MTKPHKGLKVDAYPYIFPVILTAAYWFKADSVHAFISACKFDLQLVFSGFFNLSAILTGFLFTIYCFIVVTSNPFIERIQKTQTFSEIKSFVLRTTIFSFVSAIYSLVLSSLPADIIHVGTFEKVSLVFWFFVLTVSTSYFFHCLHHFMLMSNDVPSARVTGG